LLFVAELSVGTKGFTGGLPVLSVLYCATISDGGDSII
jgi:hypothetical protein